MPVLRLGIGKGTAENQSQHPRGWIGRWVLRNMNTRHSKVTDWGLSHVAIGRNSTILDVGCGGGRTIAKLAAMTNAKVVGVDPSSASIAVASKLNEHLINSSRVEIRQVSVSDLPFAEATFDLITAVETHFWWPDLPNDVGQVARVLKAGGTFLIIAEVYRGSTARNARLIEKYLPEVGLKLMTIDEHRSLLEENGFGEIEIAVVPDKGWICCKAAKPLLRRASV
jgi:SAM-dependent methyltransferase